MAFEESPSQIKRNMESLGLDLEKWVGRGLLHFHAARPSMYGLEMHLATIHKMVKDLEPKVVILDPISNLTGMGSVNEVHAMLVRLIDYLKSQGITGLFTALTNGAQAHIEATEVGISSLIDTWLLVRDIEHDGERNRGMYVIKSRGMSHSNQIREFLITDKGVDLLDVYVGPAGVVTGSGRVNLEASERAEALRTGQEIEMLNERIKRKRQALEAEWAARQAELAAEEADAALQLEQKRKALERLALDRMEMARHRRAEPAAKAGQAEKGD